MELGVVLFILIVAVVVRLAWQHEKKFDGYEEVYNEQD